MTRIFKINDSVTLHYEHEEKFKTVDIGIYLYRRMDNAQNVSKTALLPLVLRQGCQKYPTARKISMELEDLYGASLSVSVTKRGEIQLIRLGIKAILDQYCMSGQELSKKALPLLFEMLFRPLVSENAFSEEIVNTEKTGLIDEIESIINDKKEYAMVRCFEALCEGEAYALSENGTIDEVKKINARDLFSFYQEFIKTAPIDIYITGDVDIEAAKEVMQVYLPSGNRLGYPNVSLSVPKKEIRYVEDKMDINQGKLCLGFKTNISTTDKLYFPLIVANEVFGGGPASKLFNNVREKLSLCYYVFSRLESLKGLMIVSCGVEFDKFEVAQAEIMRQFEDVKNLNFTDDDFSNSILSIENSLRSMRDSQRQMQDFNVSNILFQTGDIDHYLKNILAVTKEDVAEAFSHISLDTVYKLSKKTERA